MCIRDRECPGDLVGLKPAQRPQGQRYLSFQSQRRVAAGEDQAKAIIGNFGAVVIRFFEGRTQLIEAVGLNLLLEPRLATDVINGFVPGSLYDPGARELRDAGSPPLIHSGCKCFLGRLFGQVEIADQANQGGDDPAPIGAIQCFNGGRGIRRHAQL